MTPFTRKYQGFETQFWKVSVNVYVGLWKTVLEGFSKFVCTNGATEKSSMGDCALGFFLCLLFYSLPSLSGSC